MTDLTAPVDGLHMDCVAALAIVRAQFGQAHRMVSEWADLFAADCDRIAKRIEGTG